MSKWYLLLKHEYIIRLKCGDSYARGKRVCNKELNICHCFLFASLKTNRYSYFFDQCYDPLRKRQRTIQVKHENKNLKRR